MTTLKNVFRYNEQWNMAVSHVTLCLMMVCVAVTLEQFLQRMSPGLDLGFLGPASLVVSLEALLSIRVVKQMPTYGNERTIYRVAEAVTIVIVLRVFLALRQGFGLFFGTLSSWGTSFLETFLSVEYILSLVSLGFIWAMSFLYARDLTELEGDVEILGDATVPSNRRGIHQTMIERVLVIGVVMVIIAAVLRQVSLPVFGTQPAFRGSVLNIVAYFVLGLIFLAQTNLAALRAAWGYQRAVIGRDLAWHWTIYSIAFLLFLVLVALLLPTHYAMGFLPTLNYLIRLFISAITFLFYALSLPFLLLFSLLARLFNHEDAGQETLPPPQMPEVIAQSPAAPVPWWELLKSVLFWAFFLGIVIFAVMQYARQNQQFAKLLKRVLGRGWLNQFWGWLRSAWGGIRENVSAAVQAGLRRLRSAVPSGVVDAWQFVNLRRLSPRQKVIFYFLALVRRGGEAGSPRHPSQTPLEYSRSLTSDHPDVAQDVASMTDAFLEARYSRHEVPDEQAGRIQRFWEHVRRELKRTLKDRTS